MAVATERWQQQKCTDNMVIQMNIADQCQPTRYTVTLLTVYLCISELYYESPLKLCRASFMVWYIIENINTLPKTSVTAQEAIHKWVEYGRKGGKQNSGIAHAYIYLHTTYYTQYSEVNYFKSLQQLVMYIHFVKST